MDVKIKILKKGDIVLNAFNYHEDVAITVKRKNSLVDIIMIGKNGEQIPEIISTWSICEGDNEVEVSQGNVKISTF